MATLALSLAGQFVGGLVGGPIGATIGRALGGLAGSAVDGVLFGEKRETPAYDVRLQGSSEGGAVPRLYGWGRLAGNIIWARELELLAGEGAGAKGWARRRAMRKLPQALPSPCARAKCTTWGASGRTGNCSTRRGSTCGFTGARKRSCPTG